MPCIADMGLKISRYLDDELPHDERPTLEAHVGQCPSCAEFLGASRRNDRLVADALQDAFSPDRIWDHVASNCEEDGEEAEAEEEVPARRAGAIRFAAAAAVLVALAGAVVWQAREISRIREQTRQVAGVVADAEALTRDMDARLAMLARTHDEVRRREDTRTIRQYMDHIPETTVAYVDSGTVYITTQFPDEETFDRFDVERRRFGTARWEGFINPEPLPRPEFVDETAEPGVRYEYRFVGARDGRQVFGLPVSVTYPDRAPGGAVEVRFYSDGDGFADLILDGPDGARSARVAVGSTLEIAGRAWTLERIVEADEHLTATFAWPMTDAQGNAVYDADTGRVKVELQDRVLSARRNRRAHLTCGDESFAVWLRGRALLRP